MQKINHLAAIVGAVAYFLWGWLWYAVVFGHQWAALMGFTQPHTRPAPMPLVVDFLMALVLSYGTAMALGRGGEQSAGHGASFGLFMGIFFVASIMLTQNTFEGRPPALWLINAGYAVIGMAIVGAIVGGWKKRG